MKILLIPILMLLAGACVSSDSPPIRPGADVEMSDVEVEGASGAALRGSSEDALRLFWFYAELGDREEQLFWARIAMENGSQVGRHNYASLLIEDGQMRSLLRAEYHLSLLDRDGSPDASVLLKQVRERISKQNSAAQR